MHNGFVRIDDEKMSKSLGNFFTVRDVLKTLRDPEVLRLFLMSSHYRGPINYSAAHLAQADETLLGLYRALDGVAHHAGADGASKDAAVTDAGRAAAAREAAALAAFDAAMDDDFNTPDALAVLQGVARDLNSRKAAGDTAGALRAAATLRAMGGALGLLQQDPGQYLKRGLGTGALAEGEIEAMLEARRQARASKNFAESDRIRDSLSAAGIVLEDKPGGSTQWRRA
jgi:cysteinyl-tRNA synthetase